MLEKIEEIERIEKWYETPESLQCPVIEARSLECSRFGSPLEPFWVRRSIRVLNESEKFYPIVCFSAHNWIFSLDLSQSRTLLIVNRNFYISPILFYYN